MTVETYRELFHCLAFPVFVSSEGNALIYKNPACATYLPKIYKTKTIKNKIYPEPPKESAVVRILTGTAYSVALVLKDEENMVFLCFSRFQYEDGWNIANTFLHQFGDTLVEFLSGFKQYLSLNLHELPTPDQGNEKFFNLIQDELDCFTQMKISFFDLFDPIFNRLSECFYTYGYDLNIKTDDACPRYLFVRICPSDILFLLSKLIYLAIKYSSDKHLKIALFPDFAYSRVGLRLMVKTDLEEIPNRQDHIVCQMEKLMPECAMEFELLHRVGLLKDTDISIYIDSFGMMSISCYFPYSDPGEAFFHSVDHVAVLFSEHIGIMIENILAKIREKDASC